MKNNKPINLYTALLCAAVISSVVLRTVACFTSFDTVTMHFDGKICITIANLIVTVGVILFATYAFTESESLSLIPSNDNGTTYIPSGLLTVSLLFMAAHLSVIIRSGVTFGSTGTLRSLEIAVVAFALESVAAFFVLIFSSKNESAYKTFLCLGIVLYLCAYSAYLYFNRTVHPTNSPNKIIDQMAYLFSAMFFLFETRIALGRSVWRLYVAFGFMASLTCAYSSIPALILYIGSGYVIADSVFEIAVTLALFVFTTSRVLLTKRLSSSEQCEAAKTVEALIMAREKELEYKKQFSHAHVEDNNEESKTVDAENYSFDIPPVETTSVSEEVEA